MLNFISQSVLQNPKLCRKLCNVDSYNYFCYINGRNKYLKTCCKFNQNIDIKSVDFNNKVDKEIKCRKNPLGIQMISGALRKKLFENIEIKTKRDKVHLAKQELKSHGLWRRKAEYNPVIKFNIPFNIEDDLYTHMSSIGEEQISSYMNLLQSLQTNKLPKKPEQWCISSGWTRYSESGVTSVSHPECGALIIDSETCIPGSLLPLVAVAVSEKYWYSWCSQSIAGDPSYTQASGDASNLIPLCDPSLGGDSKEKKILVNFGISYNKVHFKELYDLCHNIKLLDLKSMNIAVCGYSTNQKSLLENQNVEITQTWPKVGCFASLNESHKFHKGANLDFSMFNEISKDIATVKLNIKNHIDHCFLKTKASYNIFNILLPTFLKRIPNPVSLAGMLELGSMHLPVMNHKHDKEKGSTKTQSNMIVWSDSNSSLFKDNKENNHLKSDEKPGILLLPVDICNNVYRRCQITSSYISKLQEFNNCKVAAPNGYKFLRADISPVAKWINALFGDSFFSRLDGSTGLGWIINTENDNQGADYLHTLLASESGITKQQAKILNEQSIYAPTPRLLQKILKELDTSLTDLQVETKIQMFLDATLGDECWYMKPDAQCLLQALGIQYKGEPVSKHQIDKYVKLLNEKFKYEPDDLIQYPSFWINGLESHTWNCRKLLANSPSPTTPVLGAYITKPLEPSVDRKAHTTRMAWVAKSSVIDYIHLVVTKMKWLCGKYKIDAKFSVVTNDEISYMVATDDCYRAALGLQISHLIARGVFAVRFGTNDIPQASAFINKIKISDTCLQHASTTDQEISMGDILKHTNGDL